MPKIVDSNGDTKFYRGPGRTSDKNMDTREDRFQTEYIKLLSRVRYLERKLQDAESEIEFLKSSDKKKKYLTKKQRPQIRIQNSLLFTRKEKP